MGSPSVADPGFLSGGGGGGGKEVDLTFSF